jgi:hypothetical protein
MECIINTASEIIRINLQHRSALTTLSSDLAYPGGAYRHFRTKRSPPIQPPAAPGTDVVESVPGVDSEMECDDVDDTCDMDDDPEIMISICGMDSIQPDAAAGPSASKSDSEQTSGKSNSNVKAKTPRKKCMPMEMAKLYHARAAHCGRKRLYRFLRAIGVLKHWLLPNNIDCDACDIAKAKQAPHHGTLRQRSTRTRLYTWTS